MTGLRVLVADADAAIREGVRRVLQRAGHVIVGEATDGPSAATLLQTTWPDLLLAGADLRGLSTLRWRVGLGGAGGVTLVLLRTPFQPRLDLPHSGDGWYLAKPVAAEDLLTMVSALAVARPLNRSAARLEYLETRRQLEKARIALMELGGFDPVQALERLLSLSEQRGRPLRQVAEGICATAEMLRPTPLKSIFVPERRTSSRRQRARAL